MHDSMTVAFEIRRPWPSRRTTPVREGEKRWQLGVYRKHAADYPGWNPKRWWNPRYWSPFQVAFGRRWYFPSLITVWHVEPNGHDSATVCKRSRKRQDADGTWDARPTNRWRWHVHHWHIQIGPLQTLARWLFERCIECGRRYPYGYSPVSHQWDGPRPRWFKVQRVNYHHECSSLVRLRCLVDQDAQIARHLFAAWRATQNLDEREALDRLLDVHAGGDFTERFNLRHRLEWLLGWRYARGESEMVPPSDPRHPDQDAEVLT